MGNTVVDGNDEVLSPGQQVPEGEETTDPPVNTETRQGFVLRPSAVSDSVTPPTVAHQAPLSVGCSRQEDCGGLPCPPPGDLPHPGIQPASVKSPALAGGFFITRATWEAVCQVVTDAWYSIPWAANSG